MSGNIQVPVPANEPVLSYAPGTPEREELQAKLAELSGKEIEAAPIIGGEEIKTGDVRKSTIPHRHSHQIGTWHAAGEKEVNKAIAAAAAAHRDWSTWKWEDRAAVWLKAAELLATSWRSTINAATMLCQSKTSHQAEIDAACELIDFFRFNVYFAECLYEEQPLSTDGIWNRVEYRELEGYVFAVSPFNFTSIAGNLPSAPALMGNTVVWKPASSTVYSGFLLMKLFEEAGLPPGVINFLPGAAGTIGPIALTDPALAGIHFTGSTGVFQHMWRTVGENIRNYKSYPRIVGETGGKDFILAHQSCDRDALRTAIIRGAFEYQGQKCSAASRAYIPDSVWKDIKDDLLHEVAEIKMGDTADFGNFMGAVIDKGAYDTIVEFIDFAAASEDATILVGGTYDDADGFFIRPTIIEALKPDFRTMCEEIFGPVMTIYVYPDEKWSETLELVDGTSPYALTGAVFSQDRSAVREAMDALKHSAGNFYINDKPSGAVVGQQPFGGARASGTNDKAGSMLNLIRWVSARTIKENFAPDKMYGYPHMT